MKIKIAFTIILLSPLSSLGLQTVRPAISGTSTRGIPAQARNIRPVPELAKIGKQASTGSPLAWIKHKMAAAKVKTAQKKIEQQKEAITRARLDLTIQQRQLERIRQQSEKETQKHAKTLLGIAKKVPAPEQEQIGRFVVGAVAEHKKVERITQGIEQKLQANIDNLKKMEQALEKMKERIPKNNGN